MKRKIPNKLHLPVSWSLWDILSPCQLGPISIQDNLRTNNVGGKCLKVLMDNTKSENNHVECQRVSPCYNIEVTLQKKGCVYERRRCAIGKPPLPHCLFRQKTAYEGFSPVTDMANHTGLWLEKNGTEIAIKVIHVRNGFKHCYLLPRQQMETQSLLRLTIDDK